jgi:hypothetical protein
LNFDFGDENRAATSDKGATLTCRASIEFPPFSMLSLIKNGQTVATSSSGLLEINTKNINANPFGLYDCHLNASGSIFKKSSFLEEQGMANYYYGHELTLYFHYNYFNSHS